MAAGKHIWQAQMLAAIVQLALAHCISRGFPSTGGRAIGWRHFHVMPAYLQLGCSADKCIGVQNKQNPSEHCLASGACR